MAQGVKRVGFLGIMLLALLMRVSIPTGMMLVPTQGGLPRIEPCPSVLPALAAAHHQSRHDHQSPEPQPCPFGVLLFPALPSAPPALASRTLEPETSPVPLPALAAPARGPEHLHPPATGPPLRA